MAFPAFAIVGNSKFTAGKGYKIHTNGVRTHLLNMYGREVVRVE